MSDFAEVVCETWNQNLLLEGTPVGSIIDREIAACRYAVAVQLKLEELDQQNALTVFCPECQHVPEEVNSQDIHLILKGDFEDAAPTGYVVIGCEGYWTVDPELVGIERGNWEDFRTPPSAEELEGWELYATCTRCGEGFVPAGLDDLEHVARVSDYRECGGRGVITGSWRPQA